MPAHIGLLIPESKPQMVVVKKIYTLHSARRELLYSTRKGSCWPFTLTGGAHLMTSKRDLHVYAEEDLRVIHVQINSNLLCLVQSSKLCAIQTHIAYEHTGRSFNIEP